MKCAVTEDRLLGGDKVYGERIEEKNAKENETINVYGIVSIIGRYVQ